MEDDDEEDIVIVCPICGHDVPNSNYELHTVRCHATNASTIPRREESSPPTEEMSSSPGYNSSSTGGLRRRRGRRDSEASSSSGVVVAEDSVMQELPVVDLAGDDDEDDEEENESDSVQVERSCPRCTLLNPYDNDTCNACEYRFRNPTQEERMPTRIRQPDSVIRDTLIGPSSRHPRWDGRNRGRNPQPFYDTPTTRHTLERSSMRRQENEPSRTNDTTSEDSRSSSFLRSVGGSAIVGSGLAAASAYLRGGDVRESALQGAFVGAAGGAFATIANSPSSRNGPGGASNDDDSNSLLGLPPTFEYTTPRGSTIRVVQRSMFTRGGRMGRRIHGTGGDAIDNMGYDRLLEIFGDGSENRGADMRTIQNLPTTTLRDADAELPEDHRQCAICLESFQNGQTRRSLPCLHGFHKDCIDRWLQSNAVCPICKHHI